MSVCVQDSVKFPIYSDTIALNHLRDIEASFGENFDGQMGPVYIFSEVLYVCMYVWLYVCMYDEEDLSAFNTLSLCMYVRMFVCECCKKNFSICMYVCSYECMYVCTICMYVCMYACLYKRTL